jgi:hypothetical protein
MKAYEQTYDVGVTNYRDHRALIGGLRCGVPTVFGSVMNEAITKIYKYLVSDFQPYDSPIRYEIAIPMHGLLRRIGTQRGQLFAWVEIDPQVTPTQTLRILQVPTGAEFDRSTDNLKYVSTEFIGPYVYHYFARRIYL